MAEIRAAVIHRLVKNRHEKTATVITRSSLLELNEPTLRLVNDIQALYSGRPGKGFGRFETDEVNYPSATILRDHFKHGKTSFLEASIALMTVLSTKAQQVPLATGGFVVMAHMANTSGTRWFTVAMITNVPATAVSESTLDVVQAVHVDLQNLRVAGRVDIGEWMTGDQDSRYVGFLKQRGEVSDYFKHFLGCNELIASAEETKKLVKILKRFAHEAGLSAENQEVFFRKAHDFAIERQRNDQPLSLEEMSNVLWPAEPAILQRAIAESDVQISDSFVPDRRALRSFVRIKAKTEYWSLDLDRLALVSGNAKYDAKKHTLTLSNLPADLEAELRQETGSK